MVLLHPRMVRSPGTRGGAVEVAKAYHQNLTHLTPYRGHTLPHIQRVTLENYKSIRRADITFSGLDVLIGLNGSGKSNLLSFFSMLGHVRTGNLQGFVQVRSGGAASLLHCGPTTSPTLSWRVELDRDPWLNAYGATLAYSADDSLVFQRELVEARRQDQAVGMQVPLESSSRESRMNEPSVTSQANIRAVWTSMRDARYFQFHNTSFTSRIRQRRDAEPAFQLHDDGGNLAAFLVRLREEAPSSYEEIRYACREVIPWFDDFALTDGTSSGTARSTRLAIRERSGEMFAAHQISDGSLRFFALATLLCQPVDISPAFVCIDEPELGLFPAALSKVADLMLRRKEAGVQILLATQSRDLLRYLSVDPIVAERKSSAWSETTFRKLSPANLDIWYDEYTQGDEQERR